MSLSEPSRHAASIMNPIEGRLGYKFRNGLLLAEAMTHPSISLERKNYPFDNQRLEFLGDAVIQLVVTEHLYRLYPDFSEGMMTKLRTRIVSRAALKTRAQELDLGRYLMMGRGEEASGGRERASTLADAFESVVGAVYLDGGFDAAQKFRPTRDRGRLRAHCSRPRGGQSEGCAPGDPSSHRTVRTDLRSSRAERSRPLEALRRARDLERYRTRPWRRIEQKTGPGCSS